MKYTWLIFFLLPLMLCAQTTTGTKPYTFITGKDTLRYRLYAPRTDEGKDVLLPLVIWLHGKGERGRDNKSQMVNGAPALVDSIATGRYPAFVLLPQCPPDQTWSYYDKTEDSLSYALQAPQVQTQLMALIDSLQQRYPIDPDRISIVGISMGGFGAWDMAARYPGKFRSIVPICGGGAPSRADSYTGIRIWAFHGAADKVVDKRHTAYMIKKFENMNGRMNYQYTLYPNVGHNAWDYALKEKGLLEWLFR